MTEKKNGKTSFPPIWMPHLYGGIDDGSSIRYEPIFSKNPELLGEEEIVTITIQCPKNINPKTLKIYVKGPKLELINAEFEYV